MEVPGRWSADLKQVCGCGWAVGGSDAREIMAKVKRHAAEAHRMKELPAEVMKKLQSALRPMI